MKFIATAVFLMGLVGPAICQPSTPSVLDTTNVAKQVSIGAFQWQKRDDESGIASFVISNNTDKAIDSIELLCWAGDDRARGTRVMVWPSPGPIAPNQVRQFSRVNIGPVGASVACEVADAK